jgi:nitroimidazol reductase NimA-like FMN-containing flavoprotein (pyridoxamine 5'-phosphate oxidase superfamily)
MAAGSYTPTTATTFKRKPDRGTYDREIVHAILDEGFVAHVGIAVDGRPFVLPMVYGRDGDRLYLHGSVASRLLRELRGGIPVCVTVTLVDALVLARSERNHSLNYRSAVVLGTARWVEDLDEKARIAALVVDHVVPGRSAEIRRSTEQELRETAILELAIEEASAKVRAEGSHPTDLDDLTAPVWEGVVPLSTAVGTPMADPRSEGVAVPPSIAPWTRPVPSA